MKIKKINMIEKLINLLINKITQAIINSKAFESKLDDWDLRLCHNR